MEHRGLRVDSGGRVHRPSLVKDHRGEELPAPACSTGIAGWDARRLHWTDDPVDCLRCLRLGAAQVIPAAQVALF